MTSLTLEQNRLDQVCGKLYPGRGSVERGQKPLDIIEWRRRGCDQRRWLKGLPKQSRPKADPFVNYRSVALMGAHVHYDLTKKTKKNRKKSQTDVVVLGSGVGLILSLFFFFLMFGIPLRHHTKHHIQCAAGAARRRMVTKGSIGSGPGVSSLFSLTHRL